MQSNVETIWLSAQQALRSMLNPDLYNLWFQSIRAVGLENEEFVLEVSDDFCELWLKNNYQGLIRDVLMQITGQELKIKFVVSAKPPTTPVPEETVVKAPEEADPAAANNGTPREQVFNPKNTFDTFVVGENNNFAHAAALAVANAPGKSYNPLFLYGGVGLGKTHLLHAIGQHVYANKKNAKVAYLSSEKFTNEYVDAIQNNSLMKFRRKYRQMDVLLIDDVQFLSGKERIQEEFFHTFNALRDAHKQIVLTCDRPVSEIQNLEQRLVSRFEGGLVSEMQAPDAETRMAILRKKEKALGVQLPDEIINFLANRIRTNIRRLEGALIRVASLASLTGKKLTLQVVEGLLREVLHEEGRQTVNIEAIQKRVAEHYDIRLADMTSKRRPESIAFPRQVAMFLARQLTESSLNTIGEKFGGRDHGTVLHACRQVKDRMETDPNVRQVVSYLEKQLLR
jgi:chromosomal replication initiator protein